VKNKDDPWTVHLGWGDEVRITNDLVFRPAPESMEMKLAKALKALELDQEALQARIAALEDKLKNGWECFQHLLSVYQIKNGI